MSATTTPRRPARRVGRDGFAQVLHAEWTKFRTVRGWVIGVVAATLATVAIGLLATGSAGIACHGGGGGRHTGAACRPPVPVGPGGEAVTDSFYFVHQPLAGNGSITVRVTSLAGRIAESDGPGGDNPQAVLRPGLVPWAKAGILIKASTAPGSAYAAVLVTGAHGVRMQDDYTHDRAGLPGRVSPAAPRWLRLTRAGDTITGYDSADGRHWTKVSSVRLAGLPATAQAGLFATAPMNVVAGQSAGSGGPSLATGAFDHVTLTGAGAWHGIDIGAGQAPLAGGFRQAGGRFAVTGSGDIAPLLAGGAGNGYPSARIEDHLLGAFAGLIAMAVIGTMFITAEYRRGLIRLTLAASPRRGRVLAAKAIVIAAVAFAAGLVAAIAAVAVGTRISRAEGLYVFPVSALTEVRVVAGTAALLAVAAVLALAVGALLRRSAAAVTVVIVAIVLPYILALASVLPAGAGDWLLRVTPAAGFAIQQSIPQYSQVAADYTPLNGYFPLAPWAGFAVLCGYAVLALGLAILALRRRDA
jgi:ABC-type transport system involved in multi-copper enzyme maturation permease subunit